MWGKLMESTYIEMINENGELYDVYFPRGLYVDITISDKENYGLDLTKEIGEIVTKITEEEQTNE